MNPVDGKTIARRFLVDAFSDGKLDLLDGLLDSAYVDHDAPAGTPSGIDGIRYLQTTFRDAFPDLRFTIEGQLAEGDKVATRYTLRGTHRGSLFGIPATGKSIQISGISIYRIQDNKMIEAWVNYDMLGMLQQLGVAPSPAAAPA